MSFSERAESLKRRRAQHLIHYVKRRKSKLAPSDLGHVTTLLLKSVRPFHSAVAQTCIPALPVEAFKARIDLGLRREGRSIMNIDETPKNCEKLPEWVARVKSLEPTLSIPHTVDNYSQLESLGDKRASLPLERDGTLIFKCVTICGADNTPTRFLNRTIQTLVCRRQLRFQISARGENDPS